MKEPKKVCCVNCGLFAQRESDNLALFSAIKSYREHLDPQVDFSGGGKFHTHAICAVGHPYDVDLNFGDGYEDRHKLFHEIVARDRSCDDFVRWIPALLTPKEHLDMGMLADQKKWHENQNRWMMFATIIGGIVGGALSFLGGVVGGVVTYLVTKP